MYAALLSLLHEAMSFPNLKTEISGNPIIQMHMTRTNDLVVAAFRYLIFFSFLSQFILINFFY